MHHNVARPSKNLKPYPRRQKALPDTSEVSKKKLQIEASVRKKDVSPRINKLFILFRLCSDETYSNTSERTYSIIRDKNNVIIRYLYERLSLDSGCSIEFDTTLKFFSKVISLVTLWGRAWTSYKTTFQVSTIQVYITFLDYIL